jgi:two-component system nitrate/nitrite response regulator NarL
VPRCIRLAVVNDQPLFIRGLALLLPAVTDQQVRLDASTHDAALASGMVRRSRPDAVVVDLGLPDPGGIRAIAAIKRAEPTVPVLAISDRAGMAGDSGDGYYDDALPALRAGACGYLRKTSEPEELVQPLLAVVDGWAVVPHEVLQALVAGGRAECRPPILSPDERRLWCAIARGRTVSQIAGELHVSERTAKRLTAGLLRRLNVANRTEAARLAGQAGVLR